MENFLWTVLFSRGEPAILGIARDVTENKRILDALRESEETLRSLSNNLPTGMVYQILMEPGRNTALCSRQRRDRTDQWCECR